MRTLALTLWWLAAAHPLVLHGRPVTATVQIRAGAGGDVEFLFVKAYVPESIDFPVLAQKGLGCDWQQTRVEELEITGTCRHMLGAANDGADHALLLAPFVIALHGSGAQFVFLSVYLNPRLENTVQMAGNWQKSVGFGDQSYHFESDSFAALPSPLIIRSGMPAPPARLGWGFLGVVVFGAASAMVLRRFTSFPLLALQWSQLGCWVGWLAMMPPGRIAAFLAQVPVRNGYLRLAAAVFLYAAPPLIAGFVSFLVLRRSLDPAGQSEDLARRYLLPEVALSMAFGFPLMGIAGDVQDWRPLAVGMVCGVGSAIALMRFMTRRQGGPAVVEEGEFRNRVLAIAAQSGTRVWRVSILWNRSNAEANAMVWRQARHVFITDSLLRSLPKREVDAIIAHEVGHLHGGLPWFIPPRIYAAFFYAYVFSFVFLFRSPLWAESILAPVALGLLLIGAAVMRRHEYAADLRSARFTQDPAAMIAGLGRAARLRPMPLDWGRWEGLILSHPSFRSRAEVLARACIFPQKLAMTVLENPDVLSADSGIPPAYYDLAVESAERDLVFSPAVKTAHLSKITLSLPVLLLILVFGLASAVDSVPVFLLGLPAVLWITLRIIRLRHRRFFRKTALTVGSRLAQPAEGELVTILPGEELRPIEGFVAWDFGRLALAADSVVYAGEKTRFTLPRTDITAIETVSRRMGWGNAHALRIRWQGGSFLVRKATASDSRRQTAVLERRWIAWWKGANATPAGVPTGEFPLPDLPVLAINDAPPMRPTLILLRLIMLMLAVGFVVSAMKSFAVPTLVGVVAAPLLLLAIYLPGKRSAKAPTRVVSTAAAASA